MKTVQKIDTLIISDVHCGLGAARVEVATELLLKKNFSRLILLGDILHSPNFGRMKPRDYAFLKTLRELGEEKNEIEIVWVAGNHDIKLTLTPAFLGIPIVREYEWNHNGIRHLALHGDSLYDFTKEIGILGLVYLLAEWVFLFGGGRNAARIFKNTFVTKGPSDALRDRALAYGKERGIQKIFCGHTHTELHAERDGVNYWNTGSWVDEPSPYIAITDGKVEILYA